MTIEQKAKRYDETLKAAVVAHKDEDRHLKAALERIFPELKESEDEKIREALIDYFDDANKADENPLQSYGVHTDKAIAWLEKQGEPTEINPSEFDLRLNKLLKQFETLPKEELASSLSFYLNVVQNDGTYKDEEKQGEQSSAIRWYDVSLIPQEMEELLVEWDSDVATWHEIAFYHADTKTFWNGTRQVKNVTRWCYIIDLLDVQGEQKPIWTDNDRTMAFTLLRDVNQMTYISKEGKNERPQWLNSLEEKFTRKEKPADKVEPKFKVGDWVVQENIGVYKVIEVCESWYEVIDGEDNHYSISFDNEYMCHLWDITKDAKDGDVLACNNGWTCIFKTLVNDETFSSYCFMDNTKWFCETGSECHTLKEEFVKAYNGKIYPATKEQRDLLFTKMKEAGYEWDAEKKELKKIEQKPAWSEEDEKGLGDTLWAIQQARTIAKDENDMGNLWYAENWLKSLKPQNHWKPTEEQVSTMKYLAKYYAKGCDEPTRSIIEGLYEQLKQL